MMNPIINEEDHPEYAFSASASGTYSRDGKPVLETTHTDQAPAKSPPTDEMAKVRLALGGTYNIGNFESIRVDVAIEMPCPPTKKAVQTTYERLNILVSEYLADQVAQMQAEVDQHKSTF